MKASLYLFLPCSPGLAGLVTCCVVAAAAAVAVAVAVAEAVDVVVGAVVDVKAETVPAVAGNSIGWQEIDPAYQFIFVSGFDSSARTQFCPNVLSFEYRMERI